jgi:pimeloyl-ACP methyl ester carboxylesterase
MNVVRRKPCRAPATRGQAPWVAVVVVGAVIASCVLTSCSSDGPDAAPPRNSTSSSPSTAVDPPQRPDCVGPDTGRFLTPAYGPDAWDQILLLGSGTRGVVVGAQGNGDLCQTLPFAQQLVAHGYQVAVFDWRLNSENSEAMAAATRALAAAGAERIVVGGFSRGAVIGLGLSPDLGSSVVGVLSVSGGPFETDGYPTIRSVSQFRGPLLLVAAREDWVFAKGISQSIAARHPGREDLLVVPGREHALALLDGPHAEQVMAAIYRFLARVTS